MMKGVKRARCSWVYGVILWVSRIVVYNEMVSEGKLQKRKADHP